MRTYSGATDLVSVFFAFFFADAAIARIRKRAYLRGRTLYECCKSIVFILTLFAFSTWFATLLRAPLNPLLAPTLWKPEMRPRAFPGKQLKELKNYEP